MDRPREVLPTPGGPTKQRIGPLIFAAQFIDREIFENPFFDFFQIVMIFVENLLGFLDV